VLTCVIHYDVLSPVCYLYAAMNNDQRKRVYFDSSIWEPDEPEKNNEGTVLILLAMMQDMRKLNRTSDYILTLL